ncbi:hypothetical protein KCM76_10980 [Zooshikella marina]|uniref:hypothetical protein n=1 Tax=Zooshikella ganghwensis TaxID=202772 RepID=UPI001BB0C624|nr:hypothetical protein [Zooshikella ganghwensis]MBU2706511.1 hypothetical protein [Zooshikella ganghwensis]
MPRIQKYPSLFFSTVFLLISGITLLSTPSKSEEVESKPSFDLPSYYPVEFQYKAVIDQYIPRQNKLVLNAQHFPVWQNAKLHLLSQEHATLHALKSGMVIGYSMKSISNRMVINELWELPKEMAPPPH